MACRSCIEKHFRHRTLLSYLLLPVALLFSLALVIRRLLYQTLIPQYRAPVFVISVGNMIAGGSGKTPFTIYLAEELHKNGFRVAVSHRGYQSELENSVTLISSREEVLPAADRAGDEAWLIARRLPGIPVMAGKKRRRAIQLLCQKYPDLDCVILDDSFQHLKVRHDLDIIIVSEWLRFGNGFVLPAGILREPLSALRQADLIVLNRITERGAIEPALERRLRRYDNDFSRGRYRVDGFYDFHGKPVALPSIKGNKVIALAAVGNPSGFADSVREAGLVIQGGISFRDHYGYADTSARQDTLGLLQNKGARWIVTTEKDYAKLRNYQEYADCLLVLKISFEPEAGTETPSQRVISRLPEREKNA